MPRRDLEVYLRGGDGERDRAALFDSDTEKELCEDPYAPAESLRLRIGEDIDWSDVVGAVAVLERDDSTKDAGANPKSAARRSAAAGRSSVSGAAPRKVVVVIGGLAPASGKVAREHGGRRRSPCRLGGGARVFATGEAAVVDHQAEPGSPKVSCLGGVRRSSPELKHAAGEGIRRRGRWAWLVANVMSCCSARTAGARGCRGGGEAN